MVLWYLSVTLYSLIADLLERDRMYIKLGGFTVESCFAVIIIFTQKSWNKFVLRFHEDFRTDITYLGTDDFAYFFG